MQMTRPDIAEIYTQYRGKVFSYIRARISSYADAEDLCADVFEKILIKLDTYDSEKAALSTWVYTITRNCVIDFFRRNRPQDELSEDMPSEDGVDEDLLNRETLSELAAALKLLPETLREIIVLRYYDGKPLTEIAKIMGLSYGAVKLRHNAALEKLHQAMPSAQR